MCLNSDASVRRLKGPDRPLVPRARPRGGAARARRASTPSRVFDEDDPRAVLRELRPHVWVKGGDYAAADLPEAAVLAEWGGRAVTVPYLAGRSTTGLIEDGAPRAG